MITTAAAINATITAWVRKRFITATDGSDSGTRPGAYGAPDPHAADVADYWGSRGPGSKFRQNGILSNVDDHPRPHVAIGEANVVELGRVVRRAQPLSYHQGVVWRRSNWKDAGRIPPVLVSLAISGAGIATVLPPRTGDAAAKPSCTTVSVATLDRALTIDAAAVISTHPSGTAGSLICSYYGLSGHAKNEATIIYIPTTARTFHAVEKVLAQKHAVSNIRGIKSAAYDYKLGDDYYVFAFDRGYQVEMYAEVSLGRVERLARRLPIL
jgi:hypothetical protein